MKNDFKISLKVSVLGLFLTLFIATILTILLITSLRAYRSQIVLSKQQMETVTAEVQRELLTILNPAEQSASLVVKLIERDTIDLNNKKQVEDFSVELLSSLTNAAMVYWSDIKGNFIIARNEADGTISSEIINREASPPTDIRIYRNKAGEIIKTVPNSNITYDPRERPWYKDAVEKKALTWSKAYVFFSGATKTLGVTVAAPAYHQGNLLGVVGIDVRLRSLSEFLNKQKIGKTGIAYIFNDSGKLIAHPSLAQSQNSNDSTPTLTAVSTLPSWQTVPFYEFQKKGVAQFNYEDNDHTYLASFESFPSFKDKNWTIAVLVPENDFVGELKRANMITIQICILILIIGTTLITFYSRQISKSMGRLVTITSRIKEFNLTETPPLHTHIQEIAFLSDAIYEMRRGLRSFQKYVPADLVRILVKEGMGDQIGGSKQNITIFFSDIKNFTNIAEKIPPEELMQHLCDYFDGITTIIREYSGTIDKYIGDAVMAFWNSPLNDERHCYHACIAALKFQEKLVQLNEKWLKEGKQALPTRIGIHTGEAIVGNLGSSSRVNYTAIGDNINLASRLETINNVYGTKIVVSDSVVEVVNDFFVFRILDCIAVKGKNIQHKVYELVCEKTAEVDPEILTFNHQSEMAFESYQQQRWDDAINILNILIHKRPDDKATQLLFDRCTIFKKTPPPKDWDGVWRYTSKGE
jgi:adenylate cyclase